METICMPAHSDALLESLIDALKSDDRISAVWLAGSRGRGTSDKYSDIDIWVAIEDQSIAPVVSDPLRFVNGIAPTLLHVVAPSIAPANGAFIGCWIPVEDVFVQIDWYICPSSTARRLADTKLVIGDVLTLDVSHPKLLSESEVEKKIEDNLVLSLIMINNFVKFAQRGNAWRMVDHVRHADNCLANADYCYCFRTEPEFESARRSFLPNHLPNTNDEVVSLAQSLVDAVDEIAATAGIAEKFKSATDAMRAVIANPIP